MMLNILRSVFPCAALLVGPGAASAQEYVEASGPLVLHAGPGPAHPGVLEVDPGAVLRRGEVRGTFVELFVAEGFPVYVLGRFATVDPARSTARLSHDGVNLRLLPSVAGLLPVGQAGRDADELVLLDQEGPWLRVLAPVEVPLFAAEDALTAVDAGSGASRWRAGLDLREARREALAVSYAARAPDFLEDLRVRHEVELLGRIAPASLDAAALRSHLEAARALAPRATREATASLVTALVKGCEDEIGRRAAATEALARAEQERSAEAADLEREARTLAAGLRFLGRGDDVTVTGRVSQLRAGESGLSLYSILDGAGRRYKLSAPADIADLAGLVQRTVTLRGRSLTLVNVTGQVLVVDHVGSVQP